MMLQNYMGKDPFKMQANRVETEHKSSSIVFQIATKLCKTTPCQSFGVMSKGEPINI